MLALADQVEQQVERPLEGIEHDRQRIRRDVQVERQLLHRLTVDTGHRLQQVWLQDRCIQHIEIGRHVTRPQPAPCPCSADAGCGSRSPDRGPARKVNTGSLR